MRGIDDEHINACIDERLDAIVGIVSRANRGADAQRSAVILASLRVILRFLKVLRRNHALELKIVIDDEDFFDTVFVQQR